MTIYFGTGGRGRLRGGSRVTVDRNPAAASELGRRIFDVIDKLAARQFEGTEQTLERGEVVRSWAVPPVRIYYQRQSSTLWVLRIYHQAREPILRP